MGINTPGQPVAPAVLPRPQLITSLWSEQIWHNNVPTTQTNVIIVPLPGQIWPFNIAKHYCTYRSTFLWHDSDSKRKMLFLIKRKLLFCHTLSNVDPLQELLLLQKCIKLPVSTASLHIAIWFSSQPAYCYLVQQSACILLSGSAVSLPIAIWFSSQPVTNLDPLHCQITPAYSQFWVHSLIDSW